MMRAKILAKSNYGRSYGWSLLHDGKEVARLIDYKCSEMFWDDYTLQVEPGQEELVFNRDNWLNGKFIFENKYTKEIAEFAFCAGYTNEESLKAESVRMRGLYLRPKSKLESLLVNILHLFYRKDYS